MDKKQRIINEYLLGRSGYRALSKKHGVSRSAINRWVMDFQGRGRSASRVLKTVHLSIMKQKESTDKLPNDLEALQKELAKERLRNKLLTASIYIAEGEIKMTIRKKDRTTQFKK